MMKRLDVFLTDGGFCRSRSVAASLIKSGEVTVDGKTVTKPSFSVGGDEKITVSSTPEFVGRGGLKLKKALAVFDIDIENSVCMDIGASTGGFTDCMLKNGAKKVFAVDVGRGQLAPELLCDERVVNMENTDIRALSAEDILPVDFISCDVSFISLTYVLPSLSRFLKTSGHAVCLIKPQFEAGKHNVGKNGIVRSPLVHIDVIKKVVSSAEENGLYPVDIDYSPVTGGDGNIEYLLHIVKEPCRYDGVTENRIHETVSAAHSELRGESGVRGNCT